MAFIKSIDTGGVTTAVTTSSEVTIAPKIGSEIIIESDGEATTHTAWKDLHEEGLPHDSLIVWIGYCDQVVTGCLRRTKVAVFVV